MKKLREETIKWLKGKFGSELYDDLCSKRTVEDVADCFLENTSVDEIEESGGLVYCLESWTEDFKAAAEMESECSKKEIEMIQENAVSINQGLPPVYSEEDFDRLYWKEHMNKSCRISVQLRRKDYEYIKILAERSGCSLSAVVRKLIIQHQEQK